jgi:hypothetical protein
MTKKDDIAFDDAGQPVLFGPAVSAATDAILNDPRTVPILVVAMLDGKIAVRAFGAPSAEIADLLDEVAENYRKAVMLVQAKQQ